MFREGWTCNANSLSKLYTGTPALKTDFTLTGKRTMAGALQDGKNSLHRYYLNNFKDGYFQDCLEFSQGQLKANNEPSFVAGSERVQFRKPPSHFKALLISSVLFFGGLFLVCQSMGMLVGEGAGDGWTERAKGWGMQGAVLGTSVYMLAKAVQCKLG